MDKITKYGLLSCVLLIAGLCHAVAAESAGSALNYENGFVSISESHAVLLNLMEDISRKANLQFVVVGAIAPERVVSVHLDHVPVENAVRSILNGYNYAIVFNTPNNKPVFLQSGKTLKEKCYGAECFDDRKQGHTGFPDVSNEAEMVTRELIEDEIEQLQDRIDSGVADAECAKWTQIRGAKYVVHDEDRIMQYMQKLEQLNRD